MINYIFKTIKDVFSSYFLGQGIVILILCALYSGLLMLIGVKFAILIGIITGILSVIPYLGFILGIITSITIAAAQFQSIEQVLYVILGFAVIQILESFVITPKIVGKSIGIHPIAAIILIILGGMAFGPIGIIIAVPSAGVIYKIYKDKIKHTEDKNILN